jgi:hypothetical protein
VTEIITIFGTLAISILVCISLSAFVVLTIRSARVA